MTCFCRSGFAILVVSLFLIGCGASSPPATTDVDLELSGNTNQFIDWNQEDWKFVLPFWPKIYPASFNFNNLKYATAYLDFTKYPSPFVPVSLTEYRSLPRDTQNSRRLAAEKALYDAMAFHRIMIWSWEIWVRGAPAQVAKEAWYYKYGIVTPAISNLEKAAGIDPSNPFTWQHLAFFTGLVGNSHRQLQALNNGLDALDDYEGRNRSLSSEQYDDLHLMRLRMILDRGWTRRNKAQFDDSQKDVERALSLMANDEVKTHDLAREALVLQALLLVDQGHYYAARQKANQFEKWNVPVISSFGETRIKLKYNYHHVDSDFCKQWVWDMSHMKLGNKARALRPPGYRAKFLEYPAHLGFRFWQDMGRIREHFGEREKAWVFYFEGFLCRPFLSFYPTEITMGYTPVFGQKETGNAHFIAYHQFFLGGSEFAYAANRVAGMERAFGPVQRTRLGAEAIEALTVCIKKGIRPLSALALRGYAQDILNNSELAELDLHEADRLFTAAGRENPTVIRQLATLHFNRLDYQGSHELLIRYLALKPNDSATWRFNGVVLALMERYDEGLQSLDTALNMDPESTSGLYNHALVQLHLGKVAEAQNDLQQAHELSPENSEVNRLAQLIRDDPLTTVEFEHKPQKLVITPLNSSGIPLGKPATGLDANQLLALIENQKAEYDQTPSKESRLVLAYSLIEARQWEEVQILITPFWPDRISLEESLILLQADRSLGQSMRAKELALSLEMDSVFIADPRLWTLVAVTCHESGDRESGNIALAQALELDPKNRALLVMQQQLGVKSEKQQSELQQSE